MVRIWTKRDRRSRSPRKGNRTERLTRFADPLDFINCAYERPWGPILQIGRLRLQRKLERFHGGPHYGRTRWRYRNGPCKNFEIRRAAVVRLGLLINESHLIGAFRMDELQSKGLGLGESEEAEVAAKEESNFRTMTSDSRAVRSSEFGNGISCYDRRGSSDFRFLSFSEFGVGKGPEL